MTAIRDSIFPVGALVDGEFQHCGTGSLLGDGHLALTAGHVVEQAERLGQLVGLFVENEVWVAYPVALHETHPSQDVSVLRFLRSMGPSIFRIIADRQFASANYHSWGYPDYVAEEDRTGGVAPQPGEKASISPDLIFRQGYVRRRMPWVLPYSTMRGDIFVEVSEVFGSCCSGAPLISVHGLRQGRWDCFGIYVGEKSGHHTQSVGIAVPADAFADWSPAIVGSRLDAVLPTH